jgi:hypothetical protein
MLRSFRVANHKSIRDEAELLLMPAYDKSRPVVPVAAIFGANASGKSNLVDALRWMQDAVRRSYIGWEAESGVPRTPFRLAARSSVEPSLYVVDLVIDDVQYTYGFSVDDKRVLEEWLYSYPLRHKRVIFERKGDSVELGSTIPDRRTRAELLSSFTRENSLLISSAVQAKQEEVLPVYRWFREGLRRIHDRSFGVPVSPLLANRLTATASRYPEFVDLLRAADFGISDVQIVETKAQPSAISLDRAARLERELSTIVSEIEHAAEPERAADLRKKATSIQAEIELRRAEGRRQDVLFLHGEDNVPLGVSEQSAGTLAWINLLLPSLTALDTGATVVVDEVDSSLHPRLTARLIELFRSDEANPHGAQLVFTTHDATLLGTSFGREILARDEIWFVEKDATGATNLFPLSDFHPRKEENTERRYLGGSYGAVPAVFSDTLVEQLLASREGARNDSA